MPPGRDMARERWREIVERALEQIGEHQIGLGPPQPGMQKATRLRARRATDATPFLPRIVGRGRGRDRVAVARHHAQLERLGGGDGKDAGAGADIDDAGAGDGA